MTAHKDKTTWGQTVLWLTAWAAWLSVTWTRVGLGFDFLDLGVRSAGQLWPACEATLLAGSSPTLPELLPPLEGMFSLLVSALMNAALCSDGKQRGDEITHLPSIWLFFGVVSTSLTLETKYEGYTDALLILSQADDALFSFSHNSVCGPDSYWHYMLSLDTPLIHVSQISQTSSSTKINFLLGWLQFVWLSKAGMSKSVVESPGSRFLNKQNYCAEYFKKR